MPRRSTIGVKKRSHRTTGNSRSYRSSASSKAKTTATTATTNSFLQANQEQEVKGKRRRRDSFLQAYQVHIRSLRRINIDSLGSDVVGSDVVGFDVVGSNEDKIDDNDEIDDNNNASFVTS